MSVILMTSWNNQVHVMSHQSQVNQPNSTHTQTTTLDLANNKFDEPVHPVINFPLTKFGKVSRSFQKKWYEHFPWLEYSVNLDAAFCFPCRFFISSPDPAFTSVGFKDWKHATGQKGILITHSNSKYHTQAMAAWKEYETRVRTNETIGCQLYQMGSKTIMENRKYVTVVMEAILYCAQQGIPLRGHDESQDSLTLSRMDGFFQTL